MLNRNQTTSEFGGLAKFIKGHLIKRDTLQGINISHRGKRKIIFKMPFLGDMLVPWRVKEPSFTSHSSCIKVGFPE